VVISLPNWLYARPISQVQVFASMYDEVVRKIEAGEISNGSSSGEFVTLPIAYRQLSPARNGKVLIYRDQTATRVLFYLPSNTPFTTWVYMYASDDKPMDFEGECSGLERERPGWFLFHCP
jgi:hypothetical protein